MSTPIGSQHLDPGLVASSPVAPPAEADSATVQLASRLRCARHAIVAAYAAMAALFIALFDSASAAGIPSATTPLHIALKGFAFVLLTAGVLHLLLRRGAMLVERAFADAAQRETERASNDEAFRELAESLGDVFWFGHPDKLELHYVNPAYESVWGLTAESLRAAPASWLATVHPEDRDRLMGGMARYATGYWEDAFRIVRPNGDIRWIDAKVTFARDAAGQAYRVSGISRDVTAQRNLEEQLRQAEKMEPIGRLAGGIAHDFNNLLSVVLSYTGLLLAQQKPDARGTVELNEIRRACERAAELTQQLLAFSRQQVLRPKVLDLGAIVRGMERMLGRLLREDIELALKLPPACARVYADPSQIEQVVMNLAVNARDAMPTGGKLTITLQDVELDAAYASANPGVEPGRYVRLAVTDTGVGMDAGTRERLFQPFFTTKERGKGTGLGLATVFGIVKQSRGHLKVDSEPGRGTTVQAYLPATELEQPSDAPEKETPLIPIQGWETVLLVEDDDQVRGAAHAILSRHGYRVLEARDGVEATETCARFAGEIHLLLTDTVMPGISGPVLADQLTRVRPAMKTLFMSGYTADDTIREGVYTTTPNFLGKPFTPEVLLRQVRRALTSTSAS